MDAPVPVKMACTINKHSGKHVSQHDVEKCRVSVQKSNTKLRIWTLAHTYYANMGGIIVPYNGHDIYASSYPDGFHRLTSLALASVKFPVRCSPFRHLDIEENDIKDKSKTDSFAKTVAVIQILGLVLSVIVRSISQLATSQLEIVTVAFAIIAILIYLAYWDKPQNIDTATVLNLPRLSNDAVEEDSLYSQIRCSDYSSFFFQIGTSRIIPGMQRTLHSRRQPKIQWLIQGTYGQQIRMRMPNDYCREGDEKAIFVAMSIATLIFGAIHCIAWNFEFPSTTERTIWRVSSIVTTVLPALTLQCSIIAHDIYDANGGNGRFRRALRLLLIISTNVLSYAAIIYVLARLTLLGVAFSSLRAMPEDVYINTWAQYMPNVG
ncbi:hypothetical protein MMC17_003792 [Xylographa soralifera]|nr:hypothetical protein [Xylographa soralifera]